MRKLLFSGTGENRKTGKPVNFRISSNLSAKGLEAIQKNLKIGSLNLETERFHAYELSDFLSPDEWIELGVKFPDEYLSVVRLLAIAHSYIARFAHELSDNTALKLIEWSLTMESKIARFREEKGDKEIIRQMNNFLNNFETELDIRTQIKAIETIKSLSNFDESKRLKFIIRVMAKCTFYKEVRDAAKKALKNGD